MRERLGRQPAPLVEREATAAAPPRARRRSGSGEVTTATDGWFFAAARTIDGPPMSICSTHSSCDAPEATVCGERVEVHHDEVERLDAELRELLLVGLEPEVGEDAGVHPRVQGLDPAVEALGEAR